MEDIQDYTKWHTSQPDDLSIEELSKLGMEANEDKQARKPLAVINAFSGPHFFLSNFYPCDVWYDGLKYPSAEHAYQATKFDDYDIHDAIRKAKTPALAKKIAHRFTRNKDWDAVKLEVMRGVVKAKFSQNENLGLLLIATGEATLIEGNDWGDLFWGVMGIVGENHLGKILMEVREDLNRAFHNKTK